MTIKVVYNDLYSDYVEKVCQIVNHNCPEYTVELYNEDYYKEKKKAILVKASCGTKQVPFVAVYDDNKDIIKAFYGEDKSNTLEKIEEWTLQRTIKS